MPPKTKYTKEAIVSAGLELVRHDGIDSLNARDLAARLGSSTQPVFSRFPDMDSLKSAVVEAAGSFFSDYVQRAMENAVGMPKYKASGLAYIRFASEERELFRLLFMTPGNSDGGGRISPLADRLADIVSGDTGADHDSAMLIHCENWVFVHGLAVMSAAGSNDWQQSLIERMVSDVYLGLKKIYSEREEKRIEE